MGDLAPRIREMNTRYNELSKARIQTEAEMIDRGAEQVNAALVKACAQDLRSLLKDADPTERKVFLCSFIKRIEVNKKQVRVYYNLPMPQGGQTRERAEVPPIGGPTSPINMPRTAVIRGIARFPTIVGGLYSGSTVFAHGL